MQKDYELCPSDRKARLGKLSVVVHWKTVNWPEREEPATQVVHVWFVDLITEPEITARLEPMFPVLMFWQVLDDSVAK